MSDAGSQKAVHSLIETIQANLDKASSGIATLRSMLADGESPADFDPKDPANKFEVGGLMKLTPKGVEICYRLFDEGKSRYAVAALMDISFGAADHRYHAWEKAGGLNRDKQTLV